MDFQQQAIQNFGLGGGRVAGCGGGGGGMSNDPITVADQLNDSVQRLQVRSLFESAPQLVLAINATPIGATKVAAGAGFTSTVTPPISVRLSRMDWPASTAPFFLVTALTIGLCTIIAAGAVPAEAFIANARNPPLDFDGVLCGGTPLTLSATNIDTVDHRADVAFFGLNINGPWGNLCTACTW